MKFCCLIVANFSRLSLFSGLWTQTHKRQVRQLCFKLCPAKQSFFLPHTKLNEACFHLQAPKVICFYPESPDTKKN